MIKFKNLITSEMINLVKSECDNNPTIEKINFDTLFAVKVGSVMIEKYVGKKPQLNVKEGLNFEYAKLWKKDVGGIQPSAETGFDDGPCAAEVPEKQEGKSSIEFERGGVCVPEIIVEMEILKGLCQFIACCNQLVIRNE